jgi:HSP20 family protein
MNALSSYSPVRDFDLFPARLSSLADLFFGGNKNPEAQSWTPAVNVTEDEDGYHISAEIPDVPSGDVKVVVRDGVLTLRGERKDEKKSDGTKYHLIERSYGSFQRSFTLPKDANGEKVSAEFKNGVLLVTVPKREEVKPREIEVKVQ